MINTAIQTITTNTDLTASQMETVMNEIMDGQADELQMAALLTGLAMKPISIAEVTGAANAMRAHAGEFPVVPDAIDIVGTGGDHSNSFNISTTTGLILASLGIPVVKHGNRAASSKSGAADMLQALGFNIDLPEATSLEMLKAEHFCFLFAQHYHRSMRYVAPVRKALKIRTIFNILGPLVNPAHADHQVLGVYDASLLVPLARVLVELGVVSANVIFGTDGLDEASISAPTKLVQVRNGQLTETTITPEMFGLKRAPKSSIVGGTPAENAQITKAILAGAPGPKRDIVLLNAGIAINAAKPEIAIQDGINMAAEAIDSGDAQALLARLLKY